MKGKKGAHHGCHTPHSAFQPLHGRLHLPGRAADLAGVTSLDRDSPHAARNETPYTHGWENHRHMTLLRTTPRLSMEPTSVIRLIRGVESLHAARIQPTPGCSRRLHAEDAGAAPSLHTRRGGSFQSDYGKTAASQEGKRNGRTAGCTSEGSSPRSRAAERRSEWMRMEPPASWIRRTGDTCRAIPVTERRILTGSPSSSIGDVETTDIPTGSETKPGTLAGSTSRRSIRRQPVSKARPSRIKIDR